MTHRGAGPGVGERAGSWQVLPPWSSRDGEAQPWRSARPKVTALSTTERGRLSRRGPGDPVTPRRRPGRLAGARGRRRQPQPGVHRHRGQGRLLRQAGAALRAAGRRELAARPQAGMVRASRGFDPVAPRPGPDSRAAAFRRAALPDRHGVLPAARDHAARDDRGRDLPAIRRAHRRVSGDHALLHLGHGAAGGREARAGGGVLGQHRPVQDHRGSGLHRSLHDLQPQPLDQPAAGRRRPRDPRAMLPSSGRSRRSS